MRHLCLVWKKLSGGSKLRKEQEEKWTRTLYRDIKIPTIGIYVWSVT